MVQSRLRPPLPLLAMVRREELVRRLATTRAAVIVVAAPGGYGKTVTLSQWVKGDGVPFAWLQADAADNDPLVFLQYLSAALEGAMDIDPLVDQWLQQTPPPVQNRILPALAAAVGNAGPFVLVVDDAHEIKNPDCWAMITLLLDQLSPGAHICLSGRGTPPLPLGRLRVAGRLLELGPAQLALSSAETKELLGLHDLAASDQTAARLTEATEGWAAALSLAALAGEGASWEEVVAGIRGDRRELARYLASEVLEQQPALVAEFLLRTSILERLSPNLCRAVIGRKDAGELLQTVASSSLFISSLDDSGEWFRYHHLFAEFLQSELLRRGEDEAAALHRRAAAWFEQHGALEEAVRHWLAAGETASAGAIVCRCHMHFAHLARYETLRRWLDMFTDEQIFSDPALTLAAAGIGSMAGYTRRSRAWLQAAFRLHPGDGTWPDAPVPLRAMHAFTRGAFAPYGVTQMRADSELAVTLSEGAPASEHAAVLAQLGIARWLTGDTQGALRFLREGEAEGAVGNVLAQITAAGYRALILTDEGRWAEARARTTAALELFREAGLPVGIPVFPVLLAQALLDAHDGDADVAERLEPIKAFAAQGTTATFQTLLCETTVAEVLLECGDVAGAAASMHAGFSRLAAWPDAGILRDRLLRLRERVEGRALTGPLTAAERRVLELLPTELSYQGIADRLSVSRETVRTHARDIYRKLGTHTRAQTVVTAREVGLLNIS